MIALNFVNKLQKRKALNDIQLIEFGPGRGTLMSDMVRTFQAFPQIMNKLKRCALIEVSPHLKEIQKRSLSLFPGIEFEWFSDCNQIKLMKGSTPLFVAREFFDALPVHVFSRSESGWREILVDFKETDSATVSFGLLEAETKNVELLRVKENFSDWPIGRTLELSPESWAIAHRIRQMLNEADGGEGIIIDYGQFGPSQNSLRVFCNHFFY